MSLGSLADAIYFIGSQVGDRIRYVPKSYALSRQIFSGEMTFGDLMPAQGSGPPPSVLRTGECDVRVSRPAFRL